MARIFALAALPLAPLLTGCFFTSVAPPPSQIPSAEQAIARLHETQACGNGIRAKATIDHFGKEGRVRGDLMLYAVAPANLRMDAVSPFGANLATLASDGKRFSLFDVREKRFLQGPAAPCNISRLTQVPLPGHVLIGLLRGLPPVLVHPPGASTIAWSNEGFYVVNVRGTRDAREELRVGVHPDDFAKPWSAQRLRLLGVRVDQFDGTLYRAELEDHKAAPMAKPWEDPDAIPGEDAGPKLSGPVCEAELPRSIHMELPPSKSDVLFRYDEVVWNPPLPEGIFTQPTPPGLPTTFVECE